MKDVYMRSKPLLQPVRVPWRISPSTSFLTVAANESDRDRNVQVTAVAQFGLEYRLPDEGIAETAAQVSSINAEMVRPVGLAGRSGPYKQLRLVFKKAGWVRISPACGDGVIPNRGYDWSAFEFLRQKGGEGIEDYRTKFWRLWRDTGFCPDPQVYNVIGSPWLLSVAGDMPHLMHLLVMGDDMYVDVLAESWSWEVIGILPG
jgi:hypothetical protein